MAKAKEPTTIKKYANRRLYNTGTSTYVTLEDLGAMVKAGEDFVVHDAKTNEDITRQVLTQIIFEQESKGQNLLPITFLRQLIRFYGDSMQALVPSFLEFSIDTLTRDQQKLREQMTQHLTGGWGQAPWINGGFGSLEEQARNNMAAFQRAFRLFTPFAQSNGLDAEPPSPPPSPKAGDDLNDLKKELAEMRSRLDRMSDEKK
ncbi:polyhydroxyalkanoate synthesis repressor PhaR [Labrys monachus]|uniref:Polyhydroxyalkanoate synthesis repressor PhaR n=1 Tax=Labrys monachus TaxID=217067 RepID=A0ABU0FP04_9HYPH|nr:polyhydroxyalkanoate synthesis repressor PhaR [Labrys monachus]MDQ0396092.1 polyhydroxyalkanoate synthesis repressor PhaR [Labrys monachus]